MFTTTAYFLWISCLITPNQKYYTRERYDLSSFNQDLIDEHLIDNPDILIIKLFNWIKRL